MQWRKNNVFNKWYLKTRHPHAEKTRKNPDKHLKTFTKIISEKKKKITDLNVKLKTIKLLEGINK